MSAHPVFIPEWTPLHKRLPKHTLCLSHPVVDGKRRCLAVPAVEAEAYLKRLDRFAAEIAKVVERHRKAELARPLPRGKGPKRVKRTIPVSRMHRHRPGSRCLTPIDVPGEAGWFSCSGTDQTYGYGKVAGYVHLHRTKRGRAFLVRHLQGDRFCPTTIARVAAELREAELEAEKHDEEAA